MDRSGPFGIVGMGAVGHELARDLTARGHEVRAWDARGRPPRGDDDVFVRAENDAAAFCAGLQVVFVTVQGRFVRDVTQALMPHAEPGLVVADMTAKGIAVRDAVAGLCAASGCAYADVAILDPVLATSASISLLASGPGAAAVGQALTGTRFTTALGDPVRPMSTEAKLCRSVFTKGLAGLLLETMVIADRAELTDFVLPGIVTSMRIDFAEVIEILLGGWLLHAERRAAEMDAVEDFVRRYVDRPQMTPMTRSVFAKVAAAEGLSGRSAAEVASAVASTALFDTP